MKNRTATIFGTVADVPDEASFRWLSQKEFSALSSVEKDAYLYRIFALVNRKPDARSAPPQDLLDPS